MSMKRWAAKSLAMVKRLIAQTAASWAAATVATPSTSPTKAELANIVHWQRGR